ncbi:hypothetical protein FV234_11585 [Methylobacterium sp. WL8]|nr:hypothetical protein FV234_11585 [Methylobacterium sp. WL8]
MIEAEAVSGKPARRLSEARIRHPEGIDRIWSDPARPAGAASAAGPKGPAARPVRPPDSFLTDLSTALPATSEDGKPTGNGRRATVSPDQHRNPDR